MVANAVDKNTLELFTSELLSRVFHSIIKNFKRFTVSAAGGMQVITDFNAYYRLASSLGCVSQETLELYTVLKELGHVYIVDVEGLKQLIHDQQTTRFKEALRTEDLLELVCLRLDWTKIRNRVETSDCIIS
jgi:hypothetical protein